MVWPFPEGHTCRTCKRVFCTVARCQMHEREAHPPRMSCPLCSVKTYEVEEILCHLEVHLPLICCHPRCGVLLTNKLELFVHKAFAHLQSAPSGLVPPGLKFLNRDSAQAPKSPLPAAMRSQQNSPLSTPKRRYPLESPQMAQKKISDGERTPTVVVSAQPGTSSLTPAFGTLHLGISPLSHSSHFETCYEDDELMVTALDASESAVFHDQSHNQIFYTPK
ncbi:uncharacterized protein LOC132204322 [Neocloeon triangulifer]|uniref:uncharacterized protein LOC132204322 n=1 Tax=Neocloeon triangulifer TaxID=2078957 RepID=UPI00286F74A4|nr:uncharacterized protein LOC132204322 [Neocloeon triangulifer]